MLGDFAWPLLMPKAPAESLASFLRRQDASTLADVLIELAGEHQGVQARLARMQVADRPDKLASAFRKTLAGWRRSTRFRGYRESREFGHLLQEWLDQVSRELLPRDPPAALELFESFIEADEAWFGNADDSDGCIGDAVRVACHHWLEAARRCEAPADGWPGRLLSLLQADSYGAREELLRRADLLLAEPALRELVALFESRMTTTLSGASEGQELPYEVFKISAGLSLLAQALGDPDVHVRSVLSYQPEPNALQREHFVRAYLQAGRPADAMAWLQSPWGVREETRQSLLSDVLGALGRFDESGRIRQEIFERTLAVFDLQRWLEHVPEASRPAALAHGRELALKSEDPTTAAVLLLELGDAQGAEAKLVCDPARIDGQNYPTLVPLAKDLQGHECWRGETVVYRALLRAILERGYARAYGHAARYWARLREIAHAGVDLTPLPAHGDFEVEIRARHARKAAFWAWVNGKRSMGADEESDG